ncbi:MAG: DNA primase [candidate division KSB1 bacterium]|nr:DNA primase [candidate division KSB1 bacterium]
MSYKIPEEKIAQVRDATDIVALISNYLTLKKSGKGYQGLCPFHADNSPSFYVNPNTQLYYCFGCQKGGNVFNFLMEMEKMSFIEAVEFLAEKAGITLPRSQVDERREKEREALCFVNRWAANLFYKNLFSPNGKAALDYLQGRGISHEMIKTFGLGYSLPEWDGLIRQAQKVSVSTEILLKAGLIIKRDAGGYYDRFRGRIMVPIIDLYKKVLGFGARRLIEDDSPKYINSPETPIYQKGQILFGLYQSRDAIKQQDQAILVEGYFDLISLYQAGIRNVVATSGTALTSAQARLIKRFTENVILLYDADTAGSLAAMRGADIFLDEGLEVKIVTLPAGHDPDSYVRQRGVDYFKQVLSFAKPIIKFKIETMSRTLDLSTSQGKSKLIDSLLETIIRIKDSIKQNLALKEVAEHFGLDERSLMDRLLYKKRNNLYRPEIAVPDQTIGQRSKPRPKSKYELAEEDLVRLALQDGQLLKFIAKHLSDEELSDPEIKSIFAIIRQLNQEKDRVTPQQVIESSTDPKIAARLANIISTSYNDDIDLQKLAEDCLVLLKRRRLENILVNLEKEIKIGQEKGLDVTHYAKQYLEYREQIKRITAKTLLNSPI